VFELGNRYQEFFINLIWIVCAVFCTSWVFLLAANVGSAFEIAISSSIISGIIAGIFTAYFQ
jgi:hypothetical protein